MPRQVLRADADRILGVQGEPARDEGYAVITVEFDELKANYNTTEYKYGAMLEER